jgi:hypothetical protein
VGVAEIVHFSDEPESLLIKVVHLAVVLLEVAVVRVDQILQALDGFGDTALVGVDELGDVL